MDWDYTNIQYPYNYRSNIESNTIRYYTAQLSGQFITPFSLSGRRRRHCLSRRRCRSRCHRICCRCCCMWWHSLLRKCVLCSRSAQEARVRLRRLHTGRSNGSPMWHRLGSPARRGRGGISGRRRPVPDALRPHVGHGPRRTDCRREAKLRETFYQASVSVARLLAAGPVNDGGGRERARRAAVSRFLPDGGRALENSRRCRGSV